MAAGGADAHHRNWVRLERVSRSERQLSWNFLWIGLSRVHGRDATTYKTVAHAQRGHA